MSTEQESLDVFDDCDTSKVEVKMSELSAEPLSGQDQELVGRLASSAGDLATEKESVNGGLDLSIEAQNVESEKKKVSDDSEKVMMVEDSKPELLVDKEVKGSDVRLDSEDLVEDSKPYGSGKQGSKAESLDDTESFMALEPYESKDESALDNDSAPVRSKVKFLSDSDLVWAKVRSHPWWPGQVFDASASSEKAKKHFKKGSFLVTYFGDCSFAWNDATKIKPFRQHFSQLAKQSSLPDFVDAVEVALEEVSRRIEFGLACSCVGKEVYERVKSQKVMNPGVREESSRVQGGDKVSSVVVFEPAKLVEYVKGLACSPRYDASDELMFVSQRARLLAFSRWKGFSELPEFETLQGSLESAPKMKESAPEPKKSTKRRKTEDKDDGVFEYEDTAVLKKKEEKTLAEFITEIRLSKSNGKRSHGEKKRKVVDTKPTKSAKKMKVNVQKEDSGSPVSLKNDQKVTPKKAKTSFGIGASILRVANQMHCSTTPTGLVPCSKSNGSGKSLQGRSKPEALSERKTSPNETLSSIHSASATKASNKESGDLKGSSEEQMANKDKEEAANIVGEMTTEESNLTEEKTTGSVLKEQLVNKN